MNKTIFYSQTGLHRACRVQSSVSQILIIERTKHTHTQREKKCMSLKFILKKKNSF